MSVPLFQVDAFTDTPFGGNPAAVCLLDAPRDERWMQDVAREMNLSETAFVVRRPDGFDLRWFTPRVEVELCGHATLASAHVLWEAGGLAPDAPARFHTQSGLLTCARRGAWIEMDFPAKPARDSAPPPGLVEALAAKPRNVARSHYDWLVEVGSEEEVRVLAPDLARLETIEARGVIVTSRAAQEFDFVSRFFAPRAGVAEDPVTGSAHCVLAPYWASRLEKTEMVGRQVSARGGTVRVKVTRDRVLLSGQAVTVLRGELI
jgi:predicted PhzF superfamily epimerase YddE/YHI9